MIAGWRLPSVQLAAAAVLVVHLLLAGPADQQAAGIGDSPYEREFGDIKFLDAYFGLEGKKVEVGPGDSNVPFTVIMANVGTQDVTGIIGQLGLHPIYFSPADGPGSLIYGDARSSALAGENFAVTFYVNVDEHAPLGQYPGTAKVDYSRLRESGTRTSFFDFDFKLTGDSIINIRAVDPFLTSLQENRITIQVSNNGTAPISDVELELQNTQTAISSTATSITNVENVVILDSNWEVGNIGSGESRFLEILVYVPESLKGESLRIPMSISYFNAHGDIRTIDRVVDFFVRGLIDLTIYDVMGRVVGDHQLVTGEVINEGNEDAMFAFVTMSPLGGSNLVETKQFIDEIEIDAPVPFNIPVEFDGEPRYGEHDVMITVRYKDNLRAEQFETYETSVTIMDLGDVDEGGDDVTLMVIPAAVAVAGVVFLAYRRKRRGVGEAGAQ